MMPHASDGREDLPLGHARQSSIRSALFVRHVIFHRVRISFSSIDTIVVATYVVSNSLNPIYLLTIVFGSSMGTAAPDILRLVNLLMIDVVRTIIEHV